LNTDKDLRTIMSVSPNFIGSHQILKVRRRSRRSPQWVFNDDKIKKLLVLSFPKLLTDPEQRKRAGRWAQVIQLYFKMKKSRRETAEEMGESVETVRNIIKRIRRVSIGKPADNTKRKRRKHDPL
jgi:hypothetical protein